jgi:hypothetical protein
LKNLKKILARIFYAFGLLLLEASRVSKVLHLFFIAILLPMKDEKVESGFVLVSGGS